MGYFVPIDWESLNIHGILYTILACLFCLAANSAIASHDFQTHVIDSSVNALGAVEIEQVDFDGDDDLDVVTVAVGASDTFGWYENTGSDTEFTLHVIDSDLASSAEDIVPVDFDGDGNLDVVTAASVADVGDTFAWYENDGTDRNFTRRVIASGQEAKGGADIKPVDFDGDGDTDVVTAAHTGDENDTFAWYENDGTDVGFFRHVIDSGLSADGASEIVPIDFNKDGFMDVATVASLGDTFSWYENDGTNMGFTRHVIDAGTPDVSQQAEDIAPTDFDGDGDIDVVTARADSAFAWHENEGNHRSFRYHVIESGSPSNGAIDVNPVDFEGDGDTDIVTAAYLADEFALYQNEGSDTNFTRHVIDSETFNSEWAEDAEFVDFDGDGDLDVLTAARQADKFLWHENLTQSDGSSDGGGGGGGSCVIERSGAPPSILWRLRTFRDTSLDSALGRHLTVLYYEWFGGNPSAAQTF